jgi:hypothetical protein
MPTVIRTREEEILTLTTAKLRLRILVKAQPLEPVSCLCSEGDPGTNHTLSQLTLQCGESLGRRLRIFLGDIHGNECPPPAELGLPEVALRNAQVSGYVRPQGWIPQREGHVWFLLAARVLGPQGSMFHLEIQDEAQAYKKALVAIHLTAVRRSRMVRALQICQRG